MKTIKVEFITQVPDDATDAQIANWLQFELGATALLKGGNPLSNEDLEAVPGTVSFT